VRAPLLSVQECCFAYPDDEGFRLECVSLEARAGEVLGVVGPNGSGKSTLLRLMAGLLRPERGAVLLSGQPVLGRRRKELARTLAFLPQDLETSFPFTVRDVVAMGRYPYQGTFGLLSSRDMEAVEAALRETATTSLARRRFSTLSGGEKQRVLIAGVLAQEPSVMLLDEPTAALDIHHAAEVFDLLRILSRKGIAVVAVTHDLNAAGQFCDRLVLLGAGRVARSGAPREVVDAQLLSQVYGADVRVVENPVTRTPMAIVPGGTAHDAS
jgi:iron complex transport system ATP-binding protein